MTHSLRGGGVSIPVMTKNRDGTDEGMDWGWNHWRCNVLDWKAMLKNLPVARLATMLGAAYVCRMTLEPVYGAYDMKRRDMMKRCKNRKTYPDTVPVWQWDYHILLSNGEVWRFHPDFSKRTASVAQVFAGRPFRPPPAAGLNEGDGPGT